MIYGIAGVLYYSLNTHKIKEKTIYNMINFLVELYRIKSHDWGSIIRYHIEKDKLLLADEKVKYPKGCINFGLAHGIIAPLIALAKAKKYGYNVKGINATISGLRQLYEKYSVRDMNILKYPTMLSVEDYFSNTVSKDSITYNAGWCYGNAGIVRGLMKVSYYLNDNNNYQYYKKELLSIINQELDNYNFDLPIVCHGYASVLSIQISAFRESGDKSFLITRERNMRQTIISHRNCIFNDEYTNDYSILSGESGTILTLINGIYLGKEYPKLLMIDYYISNKIEGEYIMKKIFFETLKHKFGHYLLVILCGILMVSTIYVSYAFSDSIEGIIHGQNSGIVEEMYTFINFQETYILLFILMVLVIISYIQKKSYDYVLLDTMGLKKKHRYMFIGFEYAGIIFSSVTGGLILGKILAECAKTVLQNIFYNTITTEVNYGFVALRNTLVISCEVFGILFIVFDELIACLGMDALLTVGKKNGKPLKKRPKTLLIGIFLILIGLISLLFYWGKISQSIPTVFLNAGMCLLMISLAGYYFVRLNKKEKKYYKRITWLENWYHRFFYNINMSFVVAAFLVIIMTDFSIKLLDNLPITEPKNYPYDLVWMANTDDEEFLNHLTDDEGVELRKVPCARVTTTDIAEHMGIPASTYEKWTGKSLDLKDNEIFVVYQRERFERNKVGIGYNTKNPLIYIGKARADLWLYIKGVAAPKVQYFTEKFKVVGTEDRILTGVFGSETCEHIIVFSDEYYQKNCVKADGANMAVMMNIPENYDKVVEEIKAYAQDHSQVNYFDADNGNLIYEKKELLLERSKTKLLYVASAAGNIIIMLLCGIFVLSIKMECDFPETEWKYRFYIQSGMSSAKVRKGIIKECLLSGGLPVICGTIISILYCSMLLYAKHLQIEWVHRYFKGIILIVGAIWLLFAVFIFIFAYRNIRKIEGDSGNGKK